MIILPANIVFTIYDAVYCLTLPMVLFFVYGPFREAVGSMTSWISALPYQLWTPGKPDALWASVAVAGVLLFFIGCERGKRFFTALPFVLSAGTDHPLRAIFWTALYGYVS